MEHVRVVLFVFIFFVHFSIQWKEGHSISVLMCVVWGGNLVSFVGAPMKGQTPLLWLDCNDEPPGTSPLLPFWWWRMDLWCSLVNISIPVLQAQRPALHQCGAVAIRTQSRMLTHESWSHCFLLCCFLSMCQAHGYLDFQGPVHRGSRCGSGDPDSIHDPAAALSGEALCASL